MTMNVTYRGFPLRANQKLLLEFTDTEWPVTTGRMVYTIDELDAEFYGIGQEPDAGEDENFDIDSTMGFCIDGSEHAYPNKVSELTADENPITTDGLPRIAWDDLKPGMTVVWKTPEVIVEATLDEYFSSDDGQFYAFGLTLDAERDEVYLKDTPERTTISSLTSDEVGCKNAETQKEEVL